MFRLRKSECYKSFESKFSKGGWGGGRLDFRVFESIPMPDIHKMCYHSAEQSYIY